MANEFKHKDPCTTLTQAEYIAACGDGHIFACQATGDIAYASSATVLSKLGKGAAGTILNMGGSCIPAWTATPTIGSTSWCNAGHAHAASNSGGTVCANVLAGTTLKSCVVTSSLTTVAALNAGSITCGFGAIDNGSSTITTTGLISGGSLDIDNVLINGTTIGHTCDTDLITVADQSVTIAGDLAISGGCITLTGAATDIDLIDDNACALSFDASGQAGILAIDTQNCAEGVKMSGKLTVTGAISTTGAVTVGACDTGLDVKFFGAAAGAFMLYDQSCDLLEIRGATAAGPGHLKLTTGEATVVACDVLGKIEFQAPAECGTDAIVAGANIQAVAQATFSATVNNTDLLFMTGLSGAATEKFRFTANGELGVGGANYGTDGQVLTSTGAGTAPAWEDAAGGGCVVCDTSPQLGGSLDAQTNTILNIGNASNDILATGIRTVNGCSCTPSYSFTSATNDGMFLAADDHVAISSGGAHRFSVHGAAVRVTANGTFFVSECANGNAQIGATINQLANDNQIFALKSSDVSTGLTSLPTTIDVEVDDYFAISKMSATEGGVKLSAMGESTACRVFVVHAYAGADDTAKSTSGVGAIQFEAVRHNGSNGNAAFTANSNIFAIRATDNGTSTTRYLFDVEGSAHADVEWTTYSDGRLKTNRSDIPYGLETLMQLEPQMYCRDSGSLDNGTVVLEGTPHRHIGFIAQDVRKLVPEIVQDVCENESWYSLDDGKLTAVVVKAVQELEERVTALEGK